MLGIINTASLWKIKSWDDPVCMNDWTVKQALGTGINGGPWLVWERQTTTKRGGWSITGHHGKLKMYLILRVRQKVRKSLAEERKFEPSLERGVELGFPGGAVVENPPANAGYTGSSPGPGRSHRPQSNKARAPQILSLCSRAREPQLLSPHAATTEARTPRAHAPDKGSPRTATKSSPCSPQLEKARAQQWRPNAAKNK